MKTIWNKQAFYVFFFIGVAACFTPLFAPVHEYGHFAMSTNAEIISWSRCANVDSTATAITAGYIVEFVFIILVMLLCRTIGNHNNKLFQGLAGFFFGYANCLVLYACNSDDFHVGMARIGYSIEATIAGWLIMTVPIVFALWFLWAQQLKT